MRISDWSSDVCSSDLLTTGRGALHPREHRAGPEIDPTATTIGIILVHRTAEPKPYGRAVAGAGPSQAGQGGHHAVSSPYSHSLDPKRGALGRGVAVRYALGG